MSRKQSPGYPNFSLEKAVQMASQIFEKDRRNAIDREVAALHIGYGGTSGASDKALGTLAHFQLIEKAGKGQVKVTQTLVDIIYPDSEEDKKQALITAGFAPSLFRMIRDRFDDGKPSEQALKGWLMRENFLERAVNPVARSYLETMSYLEHSEAFETSSQEESDASESDGTSEVQEDQQMTTAQQVQPLTANILPPTELNKINAEIAGDTVRVSALLDLEGLEKLEKKIAALKDFLSD